MNFCDLAAKVKVECCLIMVFFVRVQMPFPCADALSVYVCIIS